MLLLQRERFFAEVIGNSGIGRKRKMYELIQVSEKCYYINCPAKIGVYVADEDHVYLVDSGNDKDAGF